MTRVKASFTALVMLGSVVTAGAATLVAVHPAPAAGTPTVTTISSNRSYARFAQPITLTAHVTGNGGTPTGSVSFATNSPSVFESMDGFIGGDGRVPDNVGNEPTVLNFNGQTNVWYHDTTNGSLRHAWYG